MFFFLIVFDCFDVVSSEVFEEDFNFFSFFIFLDFIEDVVGNDDIEFEVSLLLSDKEEITNSDRG